MYTHLTLDQDLANTLGIFCRDLLRRGTPMIESICHAARLVHPYAVVLVVLLDSQPVRKVRAQRVPGRQRLVSRILERFGRFGRLAQILGQQQVVFVQAPGLIVPRNEALVQSRRRRARQQFRVCREFGVLETKNDGCVSPTWR